jgi:hypothetical protein
MMLARQTQQAAACRVAPARALPKLGAVRSRSVRVAASAGRAEEQVHLKKKPSGQPAG